MAELVDHDADHPAGDDEQGYDDHDVWVGWAVGYLNEHGEKMWRFAKHDAENAFPMVWINR